MFKHYIIATVFILSIPCFNTKAQERCNQELYNNKKVPIVYHDRYNINLFGVEKFLIRSKTLLDLKEFLNESKIILNGMMTSFLDQKRQLMTI